MLKLVNTMLSMNLFFVQSKNEEGQAIYKLEPCVPVPFLLLSRRSRRVHRRAIDVFIHYDGKRAEDLGPSRYAVRHMLATEVKTPFPVDETEGSPLTFFCAQMKTEELRRHDGGKTAVTFEEIIAAYKVYGRCPFYSQPKWSS